MINTTTSQYDFMIERFNDLIKELRGNYRDHFNQIALYSAGSIPLSIAYLGFIATNNSIIGIWIIYSSWILLVISMILSLYRNYYHGHYLHFNAMTDINKELLKSQKPNKDLLYTAANESHYGNLRELIEFVVPVSFISGLGMLMLFAMINVPVS